MNGIEIFDDFIDRKAWSDIEFTLMSPNFPWYYYPFKTGDATASNPEYDYQFVHTFYDAIRPSSNYFMLLDPILTLINPLAIIRIKANLTTRTPDRVTFGYHVDFNRKNPTFKTAVYYVNDNDGATVFEDGTEIESKANRLVVFDPELVHAGTTCTDQKTRAVINFNYYV